MDGVITLQNFYFAYKKSDLVLRDISFTVPKGSFTVLAGPSGAGKTTLCKAMTGIVPYYTGGRFSGSVSILGADTRGRRVSDIAMRVGLIMEDYESQLVSLTAGEEVAFALLSHGFSPAEAAARTSRALVLTQGDLGAADSFAKAARTMYADAQLRPLLPSLWQVKLGLEEKFGLDLGDWRSEKEALACLQQRHFTGRAV